jgi:hypothetical protein
VPGYRGVAERERVAMTHPVRNLAELRAVLAVTPDTALVMLPAAIVRSIIADMDAARVALSDMQDGAGMWGRGA